MYEQTNPFLQHAVNHGQSLLAGVNRTRVLSQDIISTCDNIAMSISAGNTQGALNSVQNVKNMANQVSQSAQMVNQAVNERLDMTTHILGRIQYRINEMSTAIQSVRAGTSTNYQAGWGQYGTAMSQQQMPSGQFGASVPQQPTTPMM
jgi:hypothetical protein